MTTLQKKRKRFFEVDLINGPIFKSLIFFMIPVLISSLFQQFYNTVDTMIVGNTLGDSSLAAIGASSSIYELLVGFGIGIGNGLAIVSARSFGSKDETLLKKSVATSIVIGLVTSIIITLIAHFALYPLLIMLNTPIEILEEAYGYVSVITSFTVVMFAYNLCAGLLRAIGNSFMPLVFLILSSCLNVGLDLVFIINFKMGIQGAAYATVIAQGVSMVLCILYILSKTKILIPKKAHFHLEKELTMEMLGQGISMGLMSSIVSAGTVVLQYGINGLGTLIIAGHTAARKLFGLFTMPFSSMALAISTFVSQNRGANQRDRIKKAMKYSYLYSFVLTIVVSTILFLFADHIVHFISGSSEKVVLENGALYLRIVGPFYAVLGVLLSTRFALQGLGSKVIPLISSLIEFIGKVLFVLILIPRFGYLAVIFCEPVIWCVMTVQLLHSYYNNSYIQAKGE